MASFNVKLPDNILERLSQLGSKSDEITEKMLVAGAKVVKDKVKQTLHDVIGADTKFESRSTGELESSLGVSEPALDRKGNFNIKVGFHEPRRRQNAVKKKRSYYELTNAMIANVIEYGKSGQPAKPFMRRAKRAAKKPCIEAMQSVFEEEVSKL